MEILDAYDLTGSLRDAAELAGCSHNTVKRYVEARQRASAPPGAPAKRSQLIDAYADKVEEWVDRSKGKVRADRVHAKLVWLGYTGSERTTRRAVADAKAAYRVGHRRVHRPWVTEPGMWLQYDYGDGPLVDGGEDGPVRRVGGLVTLPGGAATTGQDPPVGVRRPGRHTHHLQVLEVLLDQLSSGDLIQRIEVYFGVGGDLVSDFVELQDRIRGDLLLRRERGGR